MRHIYSVISISIILMLSASMSIAQTKFFQKVEQKGLPPSVEVIENIKNVSVFAIDVNALRNHLQDAPLEFKENGTPLPLAIPLPNGKMEVFNMVESPILSDEIAAQHPEIKTYTGNGTVDKKSIIRLSLTSSGFNAILLNVEDDAVYFQSYTKKSSKYYFNYFAKDAIAPDNDSKNKRCSVDIDAHEKEDIKIAVGELKNMTGGQLRTFRLAIAGNGEFTVRHGGTTSSAFDVIVGYVNRMNAVYRNELSVHFNLVSGTNLVYTDPMTDPYTNADEVLMLDENQSTIDMVIGAGNYDVGHVFGTTGGSGAGLAVSPSVCTASKANGVSKEGDITSYAQVFFDQLLFHEMGHQFSMSHSYNSVIPVCTTRNPGTAVEPGAGATIMSYGFTCDDDDYFSSTTTGPILKFHTISYSEAASYILGGGACASLTSTGNIPPVVTMPANITIPKSTPFSLTGSATDANGDMLTYDWEGTDTGAGTPDATTLLDTSKPPFFRSYEASTSPTRTYPIINAILDGSNTAKGDKLPSIGIATNHRFTVRDNNAAGGGLTFGSVIVTTDNGSGPFLVSSQNATVGWMIGATKTITWDVANTTSSPINCANVDILLSTDGGLTFPTTLASNTTNDGMHDIVVPNTPTTMARVKVICSTSIFFDISNANIIINSTGTFTCDDTAIALTCGQDYDGDTNFGVNNFITYPCLFASETGKEIIHKITTTATGDITATLTNLSVDLDVFILTDCSLESSCIAADDAIATATSQPAGTYYIVVDGFEGAIGTYTLNVTSTAACSSGGGSCNTPPPASGTIAAGTYQVSGAMSTGGQVLSPSNVTLKAGTSITLSTDFVAENGSTFLARIETCTPVNGEIESRASEQDVVIESIEDNDLKIYPNPSSGTTNISYTIQKASPIQIFITDLSGKRMEIVINTSWQEAGTYQIQWDSPLAFSGVLLLNFRTEDSVTVKKILISK